MSSASDTPVISLENVRVHFDNSSALDRAIPDVLKNRLGWEDQDIVRAVDGVSIDIHENEILTLVGESGCGKTTVGKTAVGLQEPTDGSVKFRGQDIWKTRNGTEGPRSFNQIRRALQIIHQDPGASLNPYRTVMATLSEPLRRWNPELDQNDRRSRILSMLNRTGITPAEDYADRYPHQLSGGEKQRIALIRALLLEPDLILADEAVSALDVSLRIEIMDLMHELQDLFNTSFIFISHNLSNARYIAGKVGGRIAVMYLGEIVEIGPAEEVINDPQHPYTKVLRWATPVLDPDMAEESMREEPPMRKIDVPDPIDPPSGCRFHTRCPEAREACTDSPPPLEQVSAGGPHQVACYRSSEDHEYWESAELG